MDISFAIGIPTINRADLLNEALANYEYSFPNTPIYIVDNGAQQIMLTTLTRSHRPANNLGVAGSWNYLCDKIFENHAWALIVNDDVVLGYDKRAVYYVIVDAMLAGHGLVKPQTHLHAFLLHRDAYRSVGKFDHLFYPAYFEDNDYGYRYSLQYGNRPYSDSRLDANLFRNSMTIKKDPNLNSGFEANKARYIEKWGGLPMQEKFTRPFNRRK